MVLLLLCYSVHGQNEETQGSESDQAVQEPVSDEDEGKGYEVSSSPIRKFINNFSFFFSTGYGQYAYKHDLSGLAVAQVRDTTFLIDVDSLNAGGANTAVYDWITAPKLRPGLTLDSGSVLVSPDTAAIQYTASAYSIPLNFGLYYNYKQYRAGIGATLELHRFREFTPSAAEDQLGTLTPTETGFKFFRYYLLLGYKFHKYRYFDFTGEVMLGKVRFLNNFDQNSIDNGVFFNLGVTIERHFSEVFGVYVRPSYERKNYTVDLGPVGSVQHKHPALFVNIGATYRLPTLRRCPIKACHIQINHVHGGKEYRSRRHKFYKWQNPKYGENYPQLIQNKGRNKKLRNPY